MGFEQLTTIASSVGSGRQTAKILKDQLTT